MLETCCNCPRSLAQTQAGEVKSQLLMVVGRELTCVCGQLYFIGVIWACYKYLQQYAGRLSETQPAIRRYNTDVMQDTEDTQVDTHSPARGHTGRHLLTEDTQVGTHLQSHRGHTGRHTPARGHTGRHLPAYM